MRTTKKLSRKNKKRIQGDLTTTQDIIDAELPIINQQIQECLNKILDDTLLDWYVELGIDIEKIKSSTRGCSYGSNRTPWGTFGKGSLK